MGSACWEYRARRVRQRAADQERAAAAAACLQQKGGRRPRALSGRRKRIRMEMSAGSCASATRRKYRTAVPRGITIITSAGLWFRSREEGDARDRAAQKGGRGVGVALALLLIRVQHVFDLEGSRREVRIDRDVGHNWFAERALLKINRAPAEGSVHVMRRSGRRALMYSTLPRGESASRQRLILEEPPWRFPAAELAAAHSA